MTLRWPGEDDYLNPELTSILCLLHCTVALEDRRREGTMGPPGEPLLSSIESLQPLNVLTAHPVILLGLSYLNHPTTSKL